eukprot:scaffold19852_cov122-Amphora_coffeaeformis.AAC.1
MSGSQFQQRTTNSSQQDHNNGSSNSSPGAMVRNMVSNASARSANNVPRSNVRPALDPLYPNLR